MSDLWTPITIGPVRLRHRLAMAPMTRQRSTPPGVPTPMNAEYYAQRASMGLLISEGTQPSDEGQGYMLTPGIYRDDHVAGWRIVTDAVHAAGGHLVIQLMHAGRMAHPDNTPHHCRGVAPSAVQPDSGILTPGGWRRVPRPRALDRAEIAATVGDFAHAARAAIAAGADGVEIHGANGYLIHQFLSDNVNRRTDRYGSAATSDRIRFAVEVATAVSDAIGAERTGFRISPGHGYNDIAETDTHRTYLALVRQLAALGLTSLHVAHQGDEPLLDAIRRDWPAVLIVNREGAPLADRIADVTQGRADITAIGVLALANPDLVERLALGGPLNEPDEATFYAAGGRRGYLDYPTLAQLTAGEQVAG